MELSNHLNVFEHVLLALEVPNTWSLTSSAKIGERFSLPAQVSIESESGVVKETRADPTGSFQGQSLDSPWDMLHVVYFAS